VGGEGNGDGEGTIFESGFETETNNFNVEWTAKVTSTGETATVATTSPHHGTKHAQFSCDGSGGGEQAYTYKVITSSSTIYSRGYFQIKTSLPSSGEQYQLNSLEYG